MLNLGQGSLWSFQPGSHAAQRVGRSTAVREAKAFEVHSFVDLTSRVAELNFRNRDLVLMFRGQGEDHLNIQRNTTLKPSLFRSVGPSRTAPGIEEVRRRYSRLEAAEKALVVEYEARGLLGRDRLRKHRMLRWAILQHYEVCPTPLLDVTQSLRIAASFASLSKRERAFVFVLGVPNISGAITASAEAGLQIIRLSSVCPPDAVRPHIQEGYLLGEYPEMTGADQKALYDPSEIDFGRRLVAKFSFNPSTFWRGAVGRGLPESALYPKKDPLMSLAVKVGKAISRP